MAGEIGWKAIQPPTNDPKDVTRERRSNATSEGEGNLLPFSSQYEPTEILGNDVRTKPEVTVENEYEVERVNFSNGLFLRTGAEKETAAGKKEGEIIALNKCQDAAAFVVDTRGQVTDFALADGVSGSLNGKVAAERAVFFAASALKFNSGNNNVYYDQHGMTKLIQEAEFDMQDFAVEDTKLAWAQEILADTSPEGSHKRLFIDLTGYKNVDGKLVIDETPLEPITLGSTTLMIGHIEGNHLHLGYAADGGYIVVNKNGVKAFGGEHEGYPPQLRLLGGNVGLKEIKYVDLELSPEDTVMVFSDGLYRGNGNPEEIAKKVLELILEGKNLSEIIEILRQNSLGKDDNSVLTFTHKG